MENMSEPGGDKLAVGYKGGLVKAGGKVARYSTRLKYYGGELAEIMMVNRAIFNPDGVLTASSQHRGKKDKQLEQILGNVEVLGTVAGEKSKSDSLARSKRRARKAVFDYSMCNPELDLFLTFTLDSNKIDRYDYKPVIKKLNTWLDNRVRRNGLKYIFVAEHHKDGAIHFHGVINSKNSAGEDTVKLVDSGVVDKKGHTVYNVEDWTLGFSTAIHCYGARSAVCKYITKYITKSDDKVGGRWYYSGGKLAQPLYVYTGISDPEDFKGLGNFEIYTKCVEGAELNFTILSRKW